MAHNYDFCYMKKFTIFKPLQSTFQITFFDTAYINFLLIDEEAYEVSLWSIANLQNYGSPNLAENVDFSIIWTYA